MRGKYSPTVSSAYMEDQNWWRNYSTSTGVSYPTYDPEGYDSYGYNEDDIDRAGNAEYVYYSNDCPHPEHADYNIAYDSAYDEWIFNGTKPVKRDGT